MLAALPSTQQGEEPAAPCQCKSMEETLSEVLKAQNKTQNTMVQPVTTEWAQSVSTWCGAALLQGTSSGGTGSDSVVAVSPLTPGCISHIIIYYYGY